MSNLFHNSRAFAPFYDTFARITGQRGVDGTPGATRVVDGTFAACFLDDGYDDVTGDGATASSVRVATVYIPRHGMSSWNETTPPKRGDTLRVLHGGSWRVTDVDATDASQYTLKLREVSA